MRAMFLILQFFCVLLLLSPSQSLASPSKKELSSQICDLTTSAWSYRQYPYFVHNGHMRERIKNPRSAHFCSANHHRYTLAKDEMLIVKGTPYVTVDDEPCSPQPTIHIYFPTAKNKQPSTDIEERYTPVFHGLSAIYRQCPIEIKSVRVFTHLIDYPARKRTLTGFKSRYEPSLISDEVLSNEALIETARYIRTERIKRLNEGNCARNAEISARENNIAIGLGAFLLPGLLGQAWGTQELDDGDVSHCYE